MRGDRRVFMAAMAGVLVGALMVAMLPAVAAVVGDPLSLGEVNRINERTDWKGKAKGAVVQVKNTGNASAIAAKADKQAIVARATDGPVAVNAKADRVAVKIKVDPGQAPIKVNSTAGTATNLSADLLDGMDSTAFLQPSSVVAVYDGGNDAVEFGADTVVRSVALTAPRDGVVLAFSSGTMFESTTGDIVHCSITTGTTLDFAAAQTWQNPGNPGWWVPAAGTRGFDVTGGEQLTVNLVCKHFEGASAVSEIEDPWLTAIFIPNS